MKLYRVYLIQNEKNGRYIGISEDVSKRLDDHNSGVSKWTAKRGPWRLAWTSTELTLTEARKLENLLKRQKGGDGLHRLLADHQSSKSRVCGIRGHAMRGPANAGFKSYSRNQ